MSSGMNRLVAILALGAILTIGITFFINVMGATDAGVDMTGSAYEDEYNSVTDISIISLSLMKILPIIIAICSLVLGVVGLAKYAKG